ncbi:hypothetical protein PR048_024247 [Dryococelus australis]|uniref:Uncharacterized protein n=1 Tax=Dryococelus australis TaxID=614101 RepID=A0ABQ9GN41_9NEOP|nr:hypothetical protein PR048_024247 [Dryococelus australis]
MQLLTSRTSPASSRWTLLLAGPLDIWLELTREGNADNRTLQQCRNPQIGRRPQKHGSDKGDNATRIKCPVTSIRKALNWLMPMEIKLDNLNPATAASCETAASYYTASTRNENGTSLWEHPPLLQPARVSQRKRSEVGTVCSGQNNLSDSKLTFPNRKSPASNRNIAFGNKSLTEEYSSILWKTVQTLDAVKRQRLPIIMLANLAPLKITTLLFSIISLCEIPEAALISSRLYPSVRMTYGGHAHRCDLPCSLADRGDMRRCASLVEGVNALTQSLASGFYFESRVTGFDSRRGNARLLACGKRSRRCYWLECLINARLGYTPLAEVRRFPFKGGLYLNFMWIRSAHFDIRKSEKAVFIYVGELGNSGSNMRSVMKATFRHRTARKGIVCVEVWEREVPKVAERKGIVCVEVGEREVPKVAERKGIVCVEVWEREVPKVAERLRASKMPAQEDNALKKKCKNGCHLASSKRYCRAFVGGSQKVALFNVMLTYVVILLQLQGQFTFSPVNNRNATTTNSTDAGMQGRGETGDSRENPLNSGIVLHDSHVRKSGSDPAGNRNRFASVGDESSNHTRCENNIFNDFLICIADLATYLRLRHIFLYEITIAYAVLAITFPSCSEEAKRAIVPCQTHFDTAQWRQGTSYAALNEEVLRADENEMRWRKRKIPEKAHRSTASSSTIPTCENPGVSRPGIEPGSSWRWGRRLSSQTAQPSAVYPVGGRCLLSPGQWNEKITEDGYVRPSTSAILISLRNRKQDGGHRRPDTPISSGLLVPLTRQQKVQPTGYAALYRLHCPRVLGGERGFCNCLSRGISAIMARVLDQCLKVYSGRPKERRIEKERKRREEKKVCKRGKNGITRERKRVKERRKGREIKERINAKEKKWEHSEKTLSGKSGIQDGSRCQAESQSHSLKPDVPESDISIYYTSFLIIYYLRPAKLERSHPITCPPKAFSVHVCVHTNGAKTMPAFLSSSPTSNYYQCRHWPTCWTTLSAEPLSFGRSGVQFNVGTEGVYLTVVGSRLEQTLGQHLSRQLHASLLQTVTGEGTVSLAARREKTFTDEVQITAKALARNEEAKGRAYPRHDAYPWNQAVVESISIIRSPSDLTGKLSADFLLLNSGYETTDFLEGLVGYVFEFLVPVRLWACSARIQSYFNKWRMLEEDYARITSEVLVPLIPWKVTWRISIIAGISIIVARPWNVWDIRINFPILICCWMLLMDVLLWSCLCTALKTSAEQLMKHVEDLCGRSGVRRLGRRRPKLSSRNPRRRRVSCLESDDDQQRSAISRRDVEQDAPTTSRSDLLEDYSTLWRQLNDLLGDTGNFLSFNYTLHVLAGCVVLVTHCYHGLLMAQGFWANATDQLYTIFYTLILFCIMDGGHQATAKVIDQTTVITEVLANTHTHMKHKVFRPYKSRFVHKVNHILKRKLLFMYVEERNEICKEQEAERHGSDKGDTAIHIKYAIATKRKDRDRSRRTYRTLSNDRIILLILRFIQVISAGNASISLAGFLTCDRSLLTAWLDYRPHLGEPGSIPVGVVPGFPQVGIKPDDTAGRRVFSESSLFHHPFIPGQLHTHLSSACLHLFCTLEAKRRVSCKVDTCSLTTRIIASTLECVPCNRSDFRMSEARKGSNKCDVAKPSSAFIASEHNILKWHAVFFVVLRATWGF